VLLNLVTDVLDLARIEAGEIEIVPRPFSLEALVDNSISIVSTTALKKGLRLSVTLDHSLPLTLLGDEARIRQVLLNLLGNAVKFTDVGEVSLRIEDRGMAQAGHVLRFSVTDTGPGIPAGKRDRLFRRFSQISRSAQRSGGTGLGLAISNQLVERMGGEMGFESEEGQGSTFWFSLALPQADSEDALSSVAQRRPSQLSGRVLVVDDLDQNRHLAQRMLETAGFAVDLAADGAEAVSAVQARTYDLVLMDIQMEGMDGVTATKAIRSLDHRTKDVPIIAMTANVLAHDVMSFKAAGMNDHVGKPFKSKQLLDKVRNWLPIGLADGGEDTQTASSQRVSGRALEQKAIDEICSTMGREWVIKGLTELTEQLAFTFKNRAGDGTDRAALARQAHMLVARAGILGFSELAELCGAIEGACTHFEEVRDVQKPAADDFTSSDPSPGIDIEMIG
jgi:CheY-like chemotaxis protein/HPt (histidine-containing phosphotransfer) domain-containing protein